MGYTDVIEKHRWDKNKIEQDNQYHPPTTTRNITQYKPFTTETMICKSNEAYDGSYIKSIIKCHSRQLINTTYIEFVGVVISYDTYSKQIEHRIVSVTTSFT